MTTQRTSEEVMREEFERLRFESTGVSKQFVAPEMYERCFQWFAAGQKSLAGKVPVEAIERGQFATRFLAEVHAFLSAVRSLQ